MRLRSRIGPLGAALLVTLTVTLTGCTSEPEPLPQVTPSPRPFVGWVPTPSPTLQAYAACLQRSQVTVDRLVGMYVVARASEAILKSANESCATERQAHQKTITAEDFRIPDEDGYRFVTQVRSCLAGRSVAVPAEDEPVLLIDKRPRAGADFDECVEVIRAMPTPSDF